jgi:hypothetical protein
LQGRASESTIHARGYDVEEKERGRKLAQKMDFEK